MPNKILIVDDSKATRELMASTVQAVGSVEVFTAISGFDALRVLPKHQFALIITDINMPDLNGLELIRFVKQNPHYKDTPLFVVTTENRATDRDRGLAMGASEYVIKPFDPSMLTALVEKYLPK
jgi:two-component system chemotaxis response regulator CheY